MSETLRFPKQAMRSGRCSCNRRPRRDFPGLSPYYRRLVYEVLEARTLLSVGLVPVGVGDGGQVGISAQHQTVADLPVASEQATVGGNYGQGATYAFTAPPTVTGVSSVQAAGTYGAGTAITITVTFSESVTVSGTPQLTLNDGGTAAYASGSGASTLTFIYTVAAGENSSDLDYASTGALVLNGGSIQDQAGNAAVLTLPAPGTDGLATANIVIDTGEPSVTIQPSNQGVAEEGLATFTAAASGNPAPTVQWEVSTDGGNTFSAIFGATSDTYSFTATSADQGNQYEAIFSNGNGAPATTVAATLTVATMGRALLARETFSADITPSSPGNFGTVAVGSFVGGGRLGGPQYMANGPTISGCVAAPTEAEEAAGYTKLAAYWIPANFDLTQFSDNEIGAWFRFSGGITYSQPNPVFTVVNSLFSSSCSESVSITNSPIAGDYSLILDGYPNLGTTPINIPVDTWTWVSLAWTSSGQSWPNGDLQLQLSAQPANGRMTIVGPYQASGYWTSIIQAGIYCSATANEQAWCGRVADAQLSAISSFSDCAIPPVDVTTPTDPQLVWQVDATNGNDASPNGPWKTIAGLAAHLLDQTVLMRYPAWVDPSGDSAMYADLPDTASKEAWCEAYLAGQRLATGDIVQILGGTYADTTLLTVPDSVTIEGVGDRVLMIDVPITTTWTQTPGYPDVWQTPQPFQGCMVYEGSGTVRASLNHCILTDPTAALTAVSNLPGSSWSYDPDYLYVHAPGSVDPNTLAWESSTAPAAGSGFEIGYTGAETYPSGDGLVKDITVIGGCIDVSGNPIGQHFGYVYSTPGSIGVYDSCVSEDSGKHGFCYAGVGCGGIILTTNCNSSFNPLFTDGTSGFGLNGTGVWSAYVDYSSGTVGSAPNAVSYYYDCQSEPLMRQVLAMQGGVDSVAAMQGEVYYRHNDGSGTQFALMVYDNCGAGFPTTSATYPSGTSMTLADEVLSDVNITTQPADETVDVGGTASFTAAAGGSPAPTVQWEANSGSGFTPLSDGGVYSGTTTTTLTISGATADLNGDQYEAIFTNSISSVSTTAATLTVETVQAATNVSMNPTDQTVNAGDTVTFTAAASGNPTPSVQWEVSSDGGNTFSVISGATSTTYSFTASSADQGNQYEAVFTNTAGTATTTAATLTVTTPTPLTAGTASMYSLTGPSSGYIGSHLIVQVANTLTVGSFVWVQWQGQASPPTGSRTCYCEVMSETTSSQVSLLGLGGSSNGDDALPSVTGTMVTILPNPPTTTTITVACTAATGGTGPYTYTWQRCTDDLSFADIAGAHSLIYTDTPNPVQALPYAYRLKIVDSASNTAYSNVIWGALASANPLSVGWIGDSILAGCYTNGNSVGTETVPAQAQACLAAIDGPRMVTMVNAAAAGTDTDEWTPAAAPLSGSTNLYDSAVNAFAAAGGVSYVMILLGTNDADNGQLAASSYQSNLQAICSALVSAGMKVILNYPFDATGVVSGEDNSQFLPPYWTAINNLVAANPGTVFLGDTEAPAFCADNRGFFAAADDLEPDYDGQIALGTLYATAIQNVVDGAGGQSVAPAVTTNPTSEAVDAGNAVIFTASASGNPAPAMQWEVSTDHGTTFSAISGATSTTYSFTATAAENGDEYEAVFSNTAGIAATTAAMLTVETAQTAPSVTKSPANQTANAGDTATFTAAASGNPAPTVQWEVSTNGGNTFSTIFEATSTTYSFTATSTENGYEYQAIFTNSLGTATTAAATLTVTTPGSLTAGTASLYSLTGLTGGYVGTHLIVQVANALTVGSMVWVQWQGQTSPPTGPRTCYCEVMSETTSSQVSLLGLGGDSITENDGLPDVAGTTVTILPHPPTTTTITVACTGATNGSGTGYSYQWQRCTDALSWQDIPGATSLVYTDTPTPVQALPFAYRLKVTDSASDVAYSNVIWGALASANPIAIGWISGSTMTGPYTSGSSVGTETVPAQTQACLAAIDGPRLVAMVNAGVPASHTDEWTPTSSFGYYNSAIAAFEAAGVQYVMILLGTNDADNEQASGAYYQGNLQTICTALVAAGMKVILNYPFETTGVVSGEDNGHCLPPYWTAINNLVAANPGTVFLGDTEAPAFCADNRGFFAAAGNLHPDYDGQIALAMLYATAIQEVLESIGGGEIAPDIGAPSVTIQPTDQTVNAGDMVTFTAAASGDPTPSVQWEVSSDGGNTFSAISGATSTTYSFTTTSVENGDEYEAVFSNTAGTATTFAATLTVLTAPTVTMNPTDQTVNAG
ncbi:MAG: immunoglobulin domain-containing protein, partial [Thermoguttaceae bacterium]